MQCMKNTQYKNVSIKWQEVTKSIKQFKMTPNEQKTHHLRIYVNDEKPRVDQHMISVP